MSTFGRDDATSAQRNHETGILHITLLAKGTLLMSAIN